MKTLLLTLAASAVLSTATLAGDFFPYTLEDFNRDQDWRAWQAEQNAERRAQELQDRLDEIEAQQEAQNQEPEDTQAQPQTRAQAGLVSLGDHSAPRANAEKAPRAQLVKLPVRPLAHREQVSVCTP